MDKQKSIAELKNFLAKNIDIDMSLDITSGHVYSRRKMQHLMCLKHKDLELQKIYELLMTHAINADHKSPGAGLYFLNIFSGRANSNNSKVIQTKKDLQKLLKHLKFDSYVESVLFECLDLIDTNTKISIRKSNGQNSYIEKTNGYKFSIKNLLNSKKNITLEQCKILCIDGYIENISEIHHVLTSLSEKKDPCVIFSRGMSEDVLHTIKINNDRKLMNVIPVLVPFDTENVNTIVDIAIVSATDVVSALKGETISSCTYEKMGHCQECLIGPGTVVLKNRSNTKRVLSHLSNLRSTLGERRELEEILTKRIKSLTASCVDIFIPNDVSYFHRTSQFDEGIRTVSAVLNNTFQPSKAATEMIKSFYKMLNDITLFTVS